MEIFVVNYTGDSRKIAKGIATWTSLGSGNLRDPSNVVNPVVLVERNLIDFNYVSIPDFNRYYFVTEIRMIRTNLMEIHLHVDVLNSFSSGILGLSCINLRTEDNLRHTPYLIDSNRPLAAYQVYKTFYLYNGGSKLGFTGMGNNVILVTAG